MSTQHADTEQSKQVEQTGKNSDVFVCRHHQNSVHIGHGMLTIFSHSHTQFKQPSNKAATA